MKKKPAVPPGATELRRNPRPLIRSALIATTYLLGFIILDFITKQFQELPGIVAWYPPAGLTYALLLAFGARFAPAVTIALLISNLFIYRMPQPPYLILLWAFIISSIYGLAVAFLRYRIRIDLQLRKLRDVTWFVFTTVFVSGLLAVLSVSSSALSSDIPRSEVLRAIFNWWIGETVGILTITPFLLVYVMPGLKRFAEGQPVRLPAGWSFPRPTLSAIGQVSIIALTLYWVFGAPVLDIYRPMYLLALPLIWIALQRGFKGISVGIVVVNSGVVFALWLFRFDLARLGELELLMIVNCIVGLLMGAVVTERKQAEEELTIVNKELLFQNEEKEKRAAELSTIVEKLKRNEELLRETGALAKVGGSEINLSDMTLNWTDEVFHIHELEPGRTPSVEEGLDYYAPEARPIIQEAVNNAIATGEGWSLELPIITAKGKHLWIRSMGKPEMKDGKTSRILGVFQDITERKQSEQALSSHELLNLTGQMGKIGGWELDLETQTLNWTDEVYRIHEVDPATKLNVAEAINFYAPEARPVITAAVQAGRDSGSPWDLDLPLITARGQHIWVRAQGAAERRDGKTVRLYGAFQEITERKRVEQVLYESEKRFRALVENSSDAITMLDAKGIALYDSPAASGMLGYAPEDWIGLNVFALIHPDDLPEIRDLFQTLVETPGARNNSTFRVRHKSGSWLWIEVVTTNFLAEPAVKAMVLNYRDITERKLAEVRIQRQLEHLTALSGIDRVISANFDLKLSLSEILNHVTKELGVDAADILILNPGLQMLEFAAERGFRAKAVRKTQIRLGESYAGRVALERHLIQISNLEDEPDNIFLKTHLKDENFVCYFGVPLIIKGQVKGVLEVFHRTALESDAEWFDFLNTLAGQAAIAVEIATLFESLQHSNSDLFLAYDATIEGWSHALDMRDKETEGHTQRVTEMTVKLARAFGLSEAELVQIRWGALLHDIGKMGVPDGILLKPEPLTDEEWVTMKKHPTFAYELLSPISYLRLALDIPYCHHEKWDGNGYPRGLKGAQVPLVARIFAVVDVWDALLSDRPYRAAWPEEKVLDHIRSLSGTHFDPQVVKISLELGLLKGQKKP